MHPRSCSRCQQTAELSLNLLLSTLAVSPRQQKSSTSIPYCRACLQRLLSMMDALPLDNLHKPLVEAYTALTDALEVSAKPSKAANS